MRAPFFAPCFSARSVGNNKCTHRELDAKAAACTDPANPSSAFGIWRWGTPRAIQEVISTVGGEYSTHDLGYRSGAKDQRMPKETVGL
jgi:hypothetical protein